jgi:hypothetical protein
MGIFFIIFRFQAGSFWFLKGGGGLVWFGDRRVFFSILLSLDYDGVFFLFI